MKRILAAVSFAVLATPALAMPYEKTQFDRGITPWVQEGGAHAGPTGAAPHSGTTSRVWAMDHSFIAPPA